MSCALYLKHRDKTWITWVFFDTVIRWRFPCRNFLGGTPHGGGKLAPDIPPCEFGAAISLLRRVSCVISQRS